MGAVGDVIDSGILPNLTRPAANVTGLSSLAGDLDAKRLELLKEMVPGLSRIAMLINPTNRYMALALPSARRGAEKLHASLIVHEVRDSSTLDATFVRLTKDRPDALLVPTDTFFVSQRSRIAQFAIENKLPSAYTFREHVEAGALVIMRPRLNNCIGILQTL